MESPSRRSQLVTQVNRMARAVAAKQVMSSGMPLVGYANSIINDGPRFYSDISDRSSLNPSLEPSR